jgi:RNA polymerase sigma-70 factor (ECF subfamily)
VRPAVLGRESPTDELQLPQTSNPAEFARVFLPHLDAAYTLARWLVRNEHDAQDVVQEAYLRALRFAGGFRGGDSRAWILKIVRNTAYTWLGRNRAAETRDEFDEAEHAANEPGIEAELLRKADAAMLTSALEALPVEFREMVVMRDIEGLSYKEIADAADIPVGTVMSRLARARHKLARALAAGLAKER